MTGPRPTCTRTEQAVGWALHALEPDEEIAVERHVPTCPDCSAAVRDAQVVMAQLATAVEQVEPPARLRASILDAAAATPQVRPQAAAQPPPSPGPRQPRTSRPTGPAGPAPGGPRPPGSQPAGRSRRLSPGRLVVGGGRGIGHRRRVVASGSAPSSCSSRRSSCSSSSTPRRRRCPVRPRSCRTSPAQATPTPCWPARTARRLRRSSSRATSAPSTRSASPPTPPTRPTCCGASRTPRPPREPLGVFDVDQSASHPANRRPSRRAAVRRVRDLP